MLILIVNVRDLKSIYTSYELKSEYVFQFHASFV